MRRQVADLLNFQGPAQRVRGLVESARLKSCCLVFFSLVAATSPNSGLTRRGVCRRLTTIKRENN